MNEQNDKKYFQDYMNENVCFGCGIHNDQGLHIKSEWDGEESVCVWESEEKYHGWSNLMNGGVMATLIDCHCMCTAMAHAYKLEGRALNTMPEYRYATGTLNVKYLKPTSNNDPVELRAKVTEVKGKKTVMHCGFYSLGEKTAEAEVIAIRVYDSSQDSGANVFKS
ncbi:PaaI family thioesterase [Reichenbachiella ulvae]|uniref:Acyl-coenzyme A thioesterase THEM4 n=1 Tax=Reichenbachiella ulvae TaxID=2980104 RepID=A0ABT3CZL8_9BACT|nr:PaaI family thioesterase [Reichenbachiella ulvae]MCV9389135.1 PaaI family thioesterase [Reichenbachiella ulvae]